MLLYAHQFISYKDMTSTVIYSGKHLLRKTSLLQVASLYFLICSVFSCIKKQCNQDMELT